MYASHRPAGTSTNEPLQEFVNVFAWLTIEILWYPMDDMILTAGFSDPS